LLDGGSRMPVGLRWSRPVRGACAPDREPCPWWHRRFGHIFCSDSGAPFSYGSRCVPLALLRRPRALWVVAESSVRVHACVLLLTLNTNKSAAGPACSSTPWLNHDSLGYYRLEVAPHGTVVRLHARPPAATSAFAHAIWALRRVAPQTSTTPPSTNDDL
jgi:hypothetical protein